MKRALIGITVAVILAAAVSQLPPHDSVWVRFGRIVGPALVALACAWAAAELVLHTPTDCGHKKYRAIGFPVVALYVPLAVPSIPALGVLVVEILLGATSAALYGGVWYARAKRKNAETFDWWKFASTMVLGGIIGAGFAVGFGGSPSLGDQVSVETTIAMYAGLTAVIEPVLKEAWRELKAFRDRDGDGDCDTDADTDTDTDTESGEGPV